MRHSKHNVKIDDQAARWVARMDRGELTADEAESLAAWVASDPRHAGALARARAVDRYFDKAAALGPDYEPRRPEAGRAWKRGGRFALAAAASLLLAVAAGMWFAAAPDQYATELGEVRRLPLPDGSVVVLNTDTRLKVAFSGAARRVDLLAGEVLLDVVPDPDRPFVVNSGDTRVNVVGTRFTIRNRNGRAVEVAVLEGIVQLERDAPDDAREREVLQVTANTLAVGQPGRRFEVAQLEPAETERRLKWRDGMVAFNGDTLAEAAAEFARYSSTRIVIDDSAIANRQVVGLYASNDPVGFARAAAISFGLEVQVEANEVRLLREP